MPAGTATMAEKTRPVRLTDEAINLARIAASYTRESMSEYVCRIIIERAQADIERLHAELHQPRPRPKGKG
jgi:hypothetical protein